MVKAHCWVCSDSSFCDSFTYIWICLALLSDSANNIQEQLIILIPLQWGNRADHYIIFLLVSIGLVRKATHMAE